MVLIGATAVLLLGLTGRGCGVGEGKLRAYLSIKVNDNC